MPVSVKNKTKDRDLKGRIKNKYRRVGSTYWLDHTSKWWVKLYMTRPKRRANRALCVDIMNGADPDELVAPLGGRKPHEYYW